VDLARTLGRQGDAELADRAYTAAFEAEPTNAQILWDRAVALRQTGRLVEAPMEGARIPFTLTRPMCALAITRRVRTSPGLQAC